MTQFLKSTTISGFDNDNTSWSSHKNIREHPPVDGGAVVPQFSDSWPAAPSGRTCDARHLSSNTLRTQPSAWNCILKLCVFSIWKLSDSDRSVASAYRNSVTFPFGWNWFYCNILIFYYCVHVDGSVNLWIAIWTWWVSYGTFCFYVPNHKLQTLFYLYKPFKKHKYNKVLTTNHLTHAWA